MKTVLLLPGAKMNPTIWQEIQNDIPGKLILYAYPHELLHRSSSVEDLIEQLKVSMKETYYDMIIAHSMGGIIALKLLQEKFLDTKELILIETNLKPAEPFYRTFLMEQHQLKWLNFCKRIMNQEEVQYSATFMKSIQEGFDYTSALRGLKVNVHILYGDRRVPNYEGRIKDLCLDRESERLLDFHFISNASHMPMLENPDETLKVIRKILFIKNEKDIV